MRMEFRDNIVLARKAHGVLRGRPYPYTPDDESQSAYQENRRLLDALWPTNKDDPNGAYIRQAVRRLNADAEFYAGLADAEAFRDADAVWQEYQFLEHVFAEHAQLSSNVALSPQAKPRSQKPKWVEHPINAKSSPPQG